MKIAITLTSFYNLSFTAINGDTINMSSYAGKKILIVNTASSSGNAWQYDSLESLQQQNPDSLVIIAFPSNSFGNESQSAEEIVAYTSIHCPHLIIAASGEVKGENRNVIYNWFGQQSDNGVISAEPLDDFYKYLIDEQGHLSGLFDNSWTPLTQ